VIAPPPDVLTSRWYPLRPHGGQTRLMRSRSRFDVVECGRRSGKTEILKRRGVIEAMEENPGLWDFLVVFAAPTREQAKAIYWDDLKSLVPSWARLKVREDELSIRLVNGSTIQVAGLDRAERIEGRPIDRFYGDEFASMKPGVWAKTIRPCVSTDGRPGRAAIYGVPRPSAQMAELAEMAQSDASGEWSYHHWTSDTVLSPEEIESARASMDPRMFAQEYCASRVNVAGRACHAFDRSVHVCDGLPYNADGPLLVCLDFNVEPGPAVIGQEHSDGLGGVFTDWLGEVCIPVDSHTELVCNKVIADWGKHRGEVLLDGDPAGGARSTTGEGGRSNWRIAESLFRAHFGSRLRAQYERKAPRVIDRLNAWNSRLRTADRRIHMRFERSRTKQLVTDNEHVQWKEGADYELDKRDLKRTHWLDAASYLIARKYPVDGGAIQPVDMYA